jgi:hypothetical protein
MDRRGNFSYICSMLKSDKQKLTARIITGATVLFLIIAGTPFFNTNSNGVNAASNPYVSPSISNLANSGPTSSGSFIFWDTNITSDNRVYYGLNESDVNNLVNGSWSMWDYNTINVSIRLSGLSANTTYYYKPESVYSGASNDSVPSSVLVTLKPGVWTSPSEYMVSPPGWTGSPVNFRTVNISAAILTDIGRYVTNLSLEAVIYNSTGGEIGKTNLSGAGPYSGSFILPDYLDEGGYVVRITGYPNVSGEFSVLRWGCANCHTNNYPSTFDPSTVHSRHYDTTDLTSLNVVHCADNACESQTTYTSISQCDGCHSFSYPNPQIFGVQHPQSGACTDCHRTPSGGNAALACVNCHADITTGQTALSPRYGLDRHYSNATCNDCHGTLTSLTTKPSCTTCHPRPGSILNDSNITIPNSIENTTHSTSQTVPCGLCHNREHDVKSLQTLDATVCRTCHPAINHDGGNQCTTCHGGDPHKISFAGGDNCIGCHGTNYSGANPMARTTLIDISVFNVSIHKNINSTPPNTATNDDCWSCHYLKDMNRQNIRKCEDCHQTGLPNFSAAPIIPDPLKHSSNPSNGSLWGLYWSSEQGSCFYCHGNANHTAPAPLGRISNLLIDPNNTMNGLLTNTTWCADCHYNDTVNTYYNGNQWSPIPPLINSNNTDKSGWINHSGFLTSGYKDNICKSCHFLNGTYSATSLNLSHSLDGGSTDCVGCHGTNYTGANPKVSTTLVDIGAFNDSIHQNINNTPPDTVNNNDCWRCHYQEDMDRSHIKKCGDCHRKPSQWHGNANVTTNWSLIW